MFLHWGERTIERIKMAYIFRTPTVSEGPMGGNRLFIRYKMNRGITLYRKQGKWYTVRYTTEDEFKAADPGYVFLGGRDYILTDTQRSELIAAGYGSYITTA